MSDIGEPKRAQLWQDKDGKRVEIACLANLFEADGVRIVVYRNWPDFAGEPIASHLTWFRDNFERAPSGVASKWLEPKVKS
jgi:hypothetical protein